MGGYQTFYGDANKYGPRYPWSEEGTSPIGIPYKSAPAAGTFGLTTRPDTANQLKEVSEKLSSGAKVIEITAIQPQILESIPEQHLDEIRRLKQLTGAELTLHGPLVEATGIGERQWDPIQRENAERQMFSAMERGHRIDPKGNILVTFHSSNGLPDPETMIKTKDGEVPAQLAVIDERTGQFGPLPKTKEDYFEGKKPDVYKELEDYNNTRWRQRIEQLNSYMVRGRDILDQSLKSEQLEKEGGSKAVLDAYKLLQENPDKYDEQLKKLAKKDETSATVIKSQMRNLDHARNYIQESFRNFKEIYNDAYGATKEGSYEREVLNQLKKTNENMKKYESDPSKMIELADEVDKGLRVLSSPKFKAPATFKPLKEFALDKASDTFSNVAFQSYQKFKDTSPIISIENPPVGLGISRAADIKDMIERSQKKFVERAKEELHMSESEAKAQAKKLIGATWDVGHINMLRKHGFSEEDILKETKTISEHVKHMHLSDNFGLEHTELPMGMGNVPTKEHLEILEKYGQQKEKIKKIIETGNWYQHFQTSPFAETLQAFGAQVYGGGGGNVSPYWSQVSGMSGGYWSGYGFNPDVHHSVYGAGFAALPTELGGQIPGSRNRLSGAPME